MKPYQIADRLSLLYGDAYPLVKELERVVNTEELSSIFTLAQFALTRQHSETVRAFMNLVYERTEDDNVFVLFKVINKIAHDTDALDALRNFMALGKEITKNDLFMLFNVIVSLTDNEDTKEAIVSLKNVCCEPELNTFPLFRVIHAIRHDVDAIDALKNVCVYDDVITRNDLFLIFHVVSAIVGEENSEAVNALKNIAASDKAVLAQTELLFRLVMAFPNPTEEVLDAVKNIIAVETEPDLFLLFKVLQAIDPECEQIALLKSNTLMKTKMADTVDFLTGGRFIIPQNMKKMINRFEGQALTDAFSRGQLRSKTWLVDIVNALEVDLGDTIYVCAGWYGVLSALLFERTDAKTIYSFDIDPSTDNPADTLNKEYIMDNMRFKSFVYDVRELKYSAQTLPVNHYRYKDATEFEKTETMHEVGAPTCVINTSCEHIENFDEWFGDIPKGTLVIMQNNNFVEHDDLTVVNTIDCEHAWVEKLNLSEVIYKGTLELDKYDRYMVIGRK